MSIAFACGNVKCKKSLRVKPELAGRKIKCPGCGAVIEVPATPEDRMQVALPAKAAAPPAQRAAAPNAVAAGAAPPKPAPVPAAAAAAPPPPGTDAPAAAGPSDLEKRWLQSPLLRTNEYLINGKILQGFQQLGPTMNLGAPDVKDWLGESRYRHTWLTAILQLFKLHSFVPHWIEVSDKENKLFAMKVVKVVNNRYDIYDPGRKELLASLKTLFSLKLWLRVLDPQGNDVGELITAQLPSFDGGNSVYGFNLNLTDGRTIGEITDSSHHRRRYNSKSRVWAGVFTGGYTGRVTPAFANDPRSKVLVLATTLVSILERFGAREFNPAG